ASPSSTWLPCPSLPSSGKHIIYILSSSSLQFLRQLLSQGVKSHIKNAVAGTKHIAKVKANVFIFEAYIFLEIL
ncbi:hypothetical protein NP568_23875, partial [Vibrio parahaemolyticus]|nr:hypothetical protein [Vibrio parahaemolyticus]